MSLSLPGNKGLEDLEQQAAERTGHERERLGKPVAPGQMKLYLAAIEIEN